MRAAAVWAAFERRYDEATSRVVCTMLPAPGVTGVFFCYERSACIHAAPRRESEFLDDNTGDDFTHRTRSSV